MVAHERVKAAHVFVEHGAAGSAEVLERRVEVDGVPEHDAVEDEPQPGESSFEPLRHVRQVARIAHQIRQASLFVATAKARSAPAPDPVCRHSIRVRGD